MELASRTRTVPLLSAQVGTVLPSGGHHAHETGSMDSETNLLVWLFWLRTSKSGSIPYFCELAPKKTRRFSAAGVGVWVSPVMPLESWSRLSTALVPNRLRKLRSALRSPARIWSLLRLGWVAGRRVSR